MTMTGKKRIHLSVWVAIAWVVLQIIAFGIGSLLPEDTLGIYTHGRLTDDYSENDIFNIYRAIAALVFLGLMIYCYRVKKNSHSAPTTTQSIFFEWLRIFAIASAILCLPFGLTLGNLHPENMGEIEIITIFWLTYSLMISVLAFSYRLTSGISWFLATVANGILVYGLIKFVTHFATYSNRYVIALIALLVLIVIIFYIYIKIQTKIKQKLDKGNSYMYMNILIWYVPFIVPLCIFSCLAVLGNTVSSETMMVIFWINLFITIALMWPIANMVKQWTALTDEKEN